MSNAIHMLQRESQIPCKSASIELIFFEQHRHFPGYLLDDCHHLLWPYRSWLTGWMNGSGSYGHDEDKPEIDGEDGQ